MANIFQNLANNFRRENVKPTVEQGVAGFSHFGGYLQERERNSKLQGRQKYVTYETFAANTAIVAASVRLFVNLAAKANWSAEPVDDSAQAQEAVEYLEELMTKTSSSWSKIVRQSAMFRFHGFSVQEWTANKPDETGRIFFRSIENRPQRTIERWDIDADGTVVGFGQRHPNTAQELYIPRDKSVYIVDDTILDNPEGMGLFRHMSESADRLDDYKRLEQMGIERDMRGIPVGRIPYSQLADDVESGKLTAAEATARITQFENFLKTQIKQPNTALAMDSLTYPNIGADSLNKTNVPLWDVTLLQGSSPGLGDVNTAISRITTEIARIAGTEGIMLGEGGAGSLALSQEKNQSLFLQVNSCLKDLQEAYQRDLVDTAWSLNGFPDEMKPQLKVEEISQRDADSVAQVLKDMAAAGATLSPDDDVVNDVRSLLGVSTVDMDAMREQMEMDAMLQVDAMASAEVVE